MSVDEFWGVDAPCSGATAVFFPPVDEMLGASRELGELYEQAKAVCAICPHVFACHARWIDAGRPEVGVWFGTAPRDRKQNLAVEWRMCHRCGEPLGAQLVAERRWLHPPCAEANRAERNTIPRRKTA
jgi:hypothetical protein